MTSNSLFSKHVGKCLRFGALAFVVSAGLGHGIADASVVHPAAATSVSLETLREVSATPALQTVVEEVQVTAPLDAQWVAGLMRGDVPEVGQPLAWRTLLGSATQQPASAPQRAQAIRALWQAALHFEPNYGQTPFAVKFAARTPGYQLYALQDEVVLAMRDSDALLRMQLVGAEVNAQPLLEGVDKLQGRSNYYIGNDPSRWQTNVPNFAKLRYSKVYPGVDWVLYGNARQLEYDFVVAPGTDPSVIALRLQGADAVRLAADGQLVATLAGRELLHSAPVIYQNVNGERRFIDGRYVLRDGDVHAPVVGFEIAAYDQSLPLVIDPLVYFTFVGGIYNNIEDDTSYGAGGDDYGYSVAVDSMGSAYITGSTSTNNAKIAIVSKVFPITGPGHPAGAGKTFSGGTDVFVTRLDVGGGIIYSTYLGGSAFDVAYAIALDPGGNVYITGSTDSADFPVLGGFSAALVGGQDAFVSKIKSNGDLGHSFYLGGTGDEAGYGIAVNAAGEAFITGYTTSTNFPPDGAASGEDAFITKVKADGTGLDYSRLTGWAGNDRGQGIVLDAAGTSAYITGYRNSPNTTGNGEAAFIAKVNGAGVNYDGSLDGPNKNNERGLAIARDDASGVYITGYTNSASGIATSGAYAETIKNQASRDAFIAKYQDTGTEFTINYASYLGGNADDIGYGIVVDSIQNAYVTGQTFSPDFPMVNPDDNVMVKGEAFLSRFNNTGAQLTYSGFWGGTENDVARGLAKDTNGDVYMVGYTNSPKDGFAFGTITPYRDYSGGADAFVAKFSIPLVSGFDFPLSVTVKSTDGSSGTINSTPPGISCSDDKGSEDCKKKYATDTTVTLNAVPGANSVFVGWGQDCAASRATPTCTLTMDAEKNVVAYFGSAYSVTLIKAGAGTGTVTSAPAGINCGADCSEDYASGTGMTLTAAPEAGSVFAGWSGACTGTSATCTVTVNAAISATATFDLVMPRATVNVNGSGRVTSIPSGINCTQVGGASCTTTYSVGTKVTFVSTPDNNSVFIGWAQDCAQAGAAATCTLTMDAAKNVAAYFEPTFNVAVAKTGDGNGTVVSEPTGIDCGGDCSEFYKNNTAVSLTANTVTGSSFTGWGGACSSAGTSKTCQLVVDSAKSVTATFTAQKHQLTVIKDGAGTGTVTSDPAGIDCGSNCSAIYGQDQTVTIAANPDSGTRFVSWSGACTGTANPCTITMSEAKTVRTTFERIQAGPLPDINLKSLITPSSGGTNAGRSVSFSLEVENRATNANETHSFIANLYLSADATIDPNQDVNTGYQCNFTGGIAATKTSICTGSFLLPAGLANGISYYLGAYIDKSQLTANDLANNGRIAANTLPVILLTVNKNGSGSGTVTSSPIGINCTANCPTANMAFMAGGNTRTSLAASAAPDSTFTGWNGAGCSGTGDCELSMTQAQTVTATFTRGSAPPPAATLSMVLSGDYNGDRRADVIWHQAVSGDAYGMLLNGFSFLEQGFFYKEPNTAWRIVNNGDLDADGKDDLIWWNNQTGQVWWMPMNGLSVAGGTMIYQETNTAWQIGAVGDLNADGKDDLIWWNNQTGQVWGMLMNGQNIGSQGQMYQEPNTAWRILAARDFTGDGKADLLWRNQTSGQVYLMPMDGLSIAGGSMFYHEPNLAWSIVAANDLNGDGKADLVWWNNQTGDVWAMLMDGATISQQGMIYQEPNTAWRIVASGDYNGDGKADLLWRNSSTGDLYQMQMNGMALAAGQFIYKEANSDWRIVANAGTAQQLPTARSLAGIGKAGTLSGAPLNPNAPRLEGITVNEYQQFTGKPLNSGSIPTAP